MQFAKNTALLIVSDLKIILLICLIIINYKGYNTFDGVI